MKDLTNQHRDGESETRAIEAAFQLMRERSINHVENSIAGHMTYFKESGYDIAHNGRGTPKKRKGEDIHSQWWYMYVQGKKLTEDAVKQIENKNKNKKRKKQGEAAVEDGNSGAKPKRKKRKKCAGISDAAHDDDDEDSGDDSDGTSSDISSYPENAGIGVRLEEYNRMTKSQLKWHRNEHDKTFLMHEADGIIHLCKSDNSIHRITLRSLKFFPGIVIDHFYLDNNMKIDQKEIFTKNILNVIKKTFPAKDLLATP